MGRPAVGAETGHPLRADSEGISSPVPFTEGGPYESNLVEELGVNRLYSPVHILL